MSLNKTFELFLFPSSYNTERLKYSTFIVEFINILYLKILILVLDRD